MKKITLVLALSVVALHAYADTKISALPAASALAGTEDVPAVQSGATVRTTPAAVATYVGSNLGKVTATTGAAVSATPAYLFTTTNNTSGNEAGLLITGNSSGAGVGFRDSAYTANQRNVTFRYTSGQLTLNACNDAYSSCGTVLYANVSAIGTWGTMTLAPLTLHLGFSGNAISTVAYGDFQLASSAGTNRLQVLANGTATTSNADTVVFKDAANGNTAAVSINGSPVCTVATGCGSGGVAQTTGSFSLTWPNACTTTPTQSWTYTKTGNVVVIHALNSATCTSDSASFVTAVGDLPAAIRPTTTTLTFGAITRNNSANDLTPGCLNIEPNGTVSVFRSDGIASPCTTGWTNSGAKQLGGESNGFPATFTYTLD